MILVDALYINDGGGKVLLDYLVSKIREEKLEVFYLFDERCEGSYTNIPDKNKLYVKASLGFRYRFYSKNVNAFSKVICFGNLPPLRRLNCEVYTYFHQPMYLNIPKEFNFKSKILFKLKQFFLDYFKNNTDYWFVQNEVIREGIVKRYTIDRETVVLMPFYPNEDLTVGLAEQREEDVFLYVSNATPHKNHKKMIESFCDFFDKFKRGKLKLTVNPKYNEVFEIICDKQKSGYPIENIGFVGREELINNYHNAEYLIFPSLEESFGLGIVEAIECGCKVIGANLPYMYQVCDPSINFDPFKKESIIHAFEQAINKEEKETEQKIFNEIDLLISLLKN